MAITIKSVKILYTAAGGRCAVCWERLCFHEAENAAPYTIGEMAHICGDKPGSNRHDSTQSQAQRDDYDNLILLCPTHHSIIDRKENEGIYTVARLRDIKADHEARILAITEQPQAQSRAELANLIVSMLDENRQSWEQYGPQSELAKKEPENDAAHAVWLSERLSIIVPNNRKIISLLLKGRRAFTVQEQAILNSFLLHARSYESWVEDETPYAAVRRFPTEFDRLMKESADVSA